MNASETVVLSRSRRAYIVIPMMVLLGAVTLTACATPGRAASVLPADATSSPSASAAPTESPSETSPPEPSPSPSETVPVETPYNGEILIVTSEVRGEDLEVTAMVPGVSELEGACTLTLEGSQHAVTVDGVEGNDVTYCKLMSIAIDVDSGAVDFRVTYTSPTTRAQSAIATVELAP